MSIRPDPTFHASPKLAMEAPPESFAYTLLLSPDFSKPDALAVIDAKRGEEHPILRYFLYLRRSKMTRVVIGLMAWLLAEVRQ